jgi:hypothetical protein
MTAGVASGFSRTRTIAIILVAVLAAACQSPEQKARAAFSARLKQEQLLSRDEMVRLYQEIGRALEGKTITVRQGAVTRELNDEERAAVIGLLSVPELVGDRGVRVVDGATLRGVNANATPPTSEIDASQTLWIDVDTFQPRRYEFGYSMPGLGDYAYDLIVTP